MTPQRLNTWDSPPVRGPVATELHLWDKEYNLKFISHKNAYILVGTWARPHCKRNPKLWRQLTLTNLNQWRHLIVHFPLSSSAAASTLVKVLSRWTVKNSWECVEHIQRGFAYMCKCAHTHKKTLHAVILPRSKWWGLWKTAVWQFFLMLICVPWLIQHGLRSSGIYRITIQH